MKYSLSICRMVGFVAALSAVAVAATPTARPLRRFIPRNHFTRTVDVSPTLATSLEAALRKLGVAENIEGGGVADIRLTYIACAQPALAGSVATCELTIDGPVGSAPLAGRPIERPTVSEPATSGSPLEEIYQLIVAEGGIEKSFGDGTRVTFPATIDCIGGACRITYDLGDVSYTFTTPSSDEVAVNVVMDSFAATGVPNVAPAGSNEQTLEIDDVACIAGDGARSPIELCLRTQNATLTYARNGQRLVPADSQGLLEALTQITTPNNQPAPQGSTDQFSLRCTRSTNFVGYGSCVVTETRHSPGHVARPVVASEHLE